MKPLLPGLLLALGLSSCLALPGPRQPPSAYVLKSALPAEATVMQSFAFGSNGTVVYIAQLVAGAGHAEKGDLCITKLGLDGKVLGSLVALNFGHGVQIGVEEDGGGDWLWTETDAVSDGKNGWGRRVARFRFVDGGRLDGHALDQSLVYAPIPGADRTTVNVDGKGHRLVLRYRSNGIFRYAVYPLEAAARGVFEPLADLAQPPELGTFQGFALLGDCLYFLDGESLASPTRPGTNTVYLSRLSLDGTKPFARRLVTEGLDLSFREPEGLSVYYGPEGPRLALGFASYARVGESPKAANVLILPVF